MLKEHEQIEPARQQPLCVLCYPRAPLVQTINADPFGEVADKTLTICRNAKSYGASKLFAPPVKKRETTTTPNLIYRRGRLSRSG